jgi:hypothetical protein
MREKKAMNISLCTSFFTKEKRKESPQVKKRFCYSVGNGHENFMNDHEIFLLLDFCFFQFSNKKIQERTMKKKQIILNFMGEIEFPSC